MEKIQWLRDHDDIAEEIAIAATKFAKENLSRNDYWDAYILLMREYAKLQNFELTEPSEEMMTYDEVMNAYNFIKSTGFSGFD